MRRRKRRSSFWKGALVVIFSTALTTLAIYASDALPGDGSKHVASVGSSSQSACPEGMAFVTSSGGGFCIDAYEASPGSACPQKDPSNAFETQENLNVSACKPDSKASARPWTNIPAHQAAELCARTGKRLPTNDEWYRAALGTSDAFGLDAPCVLGRRGIERAETTGSSKDCRSSAGAYDMIGNVWEWIDADVRSGVYDGVTLPESGFVQGVDADGVPIATGEMEDVAFGEDYFFIDHEGVRSMFRGGFWALEEKGGVYSVNATVPGSFTGVAVGFRCVRS